MNQLLRDFLEGRLSRRGFVQALTALGLSAAGIGAVTRAAEADVKKAGGGTLLKEKTGGELLVAQMKAAGTRYVFTNPGSYEVGFFDALLEHDDVKLIIGLHEGLVIAMADGYHKVSREPAFVNLHVIAGTAQASGQLYNASRDNSSLVITAGLLDNEVFNDDVVLGPRSGYNQKDVNRQFTKHSQESHHPAAVAMLLRRAYKIATTAPGGPVYIAFPNTVLEGKASAEVFDRKHFVISNEVPPHPDRVKEMAKLLVEAKRPALFFGDEVFKTDAMKEGVELAQLLGLPVYDSSLPAFHNFPRHHPLYAGAYSTKERFAGKDCVVNVGDFDVGDYDVREKIVPIPEKGPYDPDCKVARISLNTNSIGRNFLFDVACPANVKLTLRALIEHIRADVPRATLEKMRTSRWDGTEVKSPPFDKKHLGDDVIHPDELGYRLNELLDRNAIVVSENLSGSNHFLKTGFRDNEKLWISNSGACLGWGIGAALGAKLAAPDRQVVCNIGDGSVMYSAAGFWSMVRHGVPVLTVVCNNRNYQTVRHAYFRHQGEMVRKNRYPGMHLGDPDIKFVELAHSQGVSGILVKESKDLVPALKRGIAATNAGEPFLIEVLVQKLGGGANSDWFQDFKLVKPRKPR